MQHHHLVQNDHERAVLVLSGLVQAAGVRALGTAPRPKPRKCAVAPESWVMSGRAVAQEHHEDEGRMCNVVFRVGFEY